MAPSRCLLRRRSGRYSRRQSFHSRAKANRAAAVRCFLRRWLGAGRPGIVCLGILWYASLTNARRSSAADGRTRPAGLAPAAEVGRPRHNASVKLAGSASPDWRRMAPQSSGQRIKWSMWSLSSRPQARQGAAPSPRRCAVVHALHHVLRRETPNAGAARRVNASVRAIARCKSWWSTTSAGSQMRMRGMSALVTASMESSRISAGGVCSARSSMSAMASSSHHSHSGGGAPCASEASGPDSLLAAARAEQASATSVHRRSAARRSVRAPASCGSPRLPSSCRISSVVRGVGTSSCAGRRSRMRRSRWRRWGRVMLCNSRWGGRTWRSISSPSKGARWTAPWPWRGR